MNKYHIYVMGNLVAICINAMTTINGLSPDESRGDDIVYERDEDDRIIRVVEWTPQLSKHGLCPVTIKYHAI